MPPAANQPPGIFISYRRNDDDGGYVGHLFADLRSHFGSQNIFVDIESLKPGQNFVEALKKSLDSCEVLIALIGRNWLTSEDKLGRRRLDNEKDFVRLEIATSLKRGIAVIPVLLPGADMPGQHDLPEELWPLCEINAVEISSRPWHWKHDVEQLFDAIESRRIKKTAADRTAITPARGRRRETWVALAVLLALVGALVVTYVRKNGVDRLASNDVEEVGSGAAEQKPASLKDRGQGSGRLKDKKFTSTFGMEFAWVPPGEFDMGSENGFPDEKPVHRVKIGSGFYMATYEVTQAQWLSVMGKGKNPSSLKGENLPVEQISWGDTQEFVGKLNEMDKGYVYSLPTEAEWEYAARGGQEDSASDLGSMAWYETNAVAGTHPVGRKNANGFGLHDMQGNVYEWVQDSYHSSYDGAPLDGGAWMDNGAQGYGVVRGGSSYSPASFCRITTRIQTELGSRGDRVGFRIAASLKQ